MTRLRKWNDAGHDDEIEASDAQSGFQMFGLWSRSIGREGPTALAPFQACSRPNSARQRRSNGALHRRAPTKTGRLRWGVSFISARLYAILGPCLCMQRDDGQAPIDRVSHKPV